MDPRRILLGSAERTRHLWLNIDQLNFLKKAAAAVTCTIVDNGPSMVTFRNTRSELVVSFMLGTRPLALSHHPFVYCDWSEPTGSLAIPFNGFQDIMRQANEDDNLMIVIRYNSKFTDFSFQYLFGDPDSGTYMPIPSTRLTLPILGTRAYNLPFLAFQKVPTEKVQITLPWWWLRHVLSLRELHDTILASLLANPTRSSETRITFTSKGIRFTDPTSNTTDLFMSIPYEGAAYVRWDDPSFLEFDLIASQSCLASFLSATSLDDLLLISIFHNRTPYSSKVRFQGGPGELIFYYPFTN